MMRYIYFYFDLKIGGHFVFLTDPHKGVVVPTRAPPSDHMMKLEEQNKWHHPSSVNHLVLSAAE